VGALVGLTRWKGVSSPSTHSGSDDQGVLEQLRRRVASPHPDQAAAWSGRRGPSLQAVRPTRLIVVVSTRHWRNRWRGRSVARKRRYGERRPSAFNLSARLQRREASVDGVDVARCPLASREAGSSYAGSSQEGPGNEGKRRGCWAPKGPSAQGGRGLNARGVCSRVVVVDVAEVDRRRRTQRSVRSPFHPI